MPKNLVIVESPTKAKTITKYLGKGFKVEASMGHIRDLPKNEFGIDIKHDFKPQYKTIAGKSKLVKKLKDEVKKADSVYLAPDLDREGEAIAWHLKEALKLPDDKTFRVIFNEITKTAIQRAFQNPSKISMDKVNAQQARRLLDRIVGYEISPLLWRKVIPGLSAGRVQSVAVRLIVEREAEIKNFVKQEYWKIFAHLIKAGAKEEPFAAELIKHKGKNIRLKNEKETNAVINEVKNNDFTVSSVKKKRGKISPPPPFTTSLLQQQASIQLGFSTKKTMYVAQQLYEGVDIDGESVGLITYMRTDSYHLSDSVLKECRDYIQDTFGQRYLPEKWRVYKSKKSAQGAHEAIRPTSIYRTPESVKGKVSADFYKLYNLIWQRTVATQMTEAQYESTNVEIEAGDYLFTLKGRRLLFDGFSAVSGKLSWDNKKTVPELEEGEKLSLKNLEKKQFFTEPPARYTEATLVKTLESKGIGRPSTYAPIISTIQQRQYVTLKSKKFYATDLGIYVTDKLIQHFPRIFDVAFTSDMETRLDEIENGKIDWINVLNDFYNQFEPTLQKAATEMKTRAQTKEETKETCDKCGAPMVLKLSKRGSFYLSCSKYPECDFMKFPSDGQIETTDEVCSKCGSPLEVKRGKYGKFLACSKYPECTFTKNIARPSSVPNEIVDEQCGKCGSQMVVKRGKRGEFLACSAYPKCKNIRPLKNARLKTACPQCGKPLVIQSVRKSGITFACSDYPQCSYTTKELPDKK